MNKEAEQPKKTLAQLRAERIRSRVTSQASQRIANVMDRPSSNSPQNPTPDTEELPLQTTQTASWTRIIFLLFFGAFLSRYPQISIFSSYLPSLKWVSLLGIILLELLFHLPFLRRVFIITQQSINGDSKDMLEQYVNQIRNMMRNQLQCVLLVCQDLMWIGLSWFVTGRVSRFLANIK
eukprot:gnl/Trimastix_PCT/1549.p1 GENE.gnl/Trimastix_PCT/1549~~gnl/Trimastix_PCT/1549.p1  ORF type:complete len:179 (-),score=15.73 gnl/Trimastix_PCT/1549:114-650(-)